MSLVLYPSFHGHADVVPLTCTGVLRKSKSWCIPPISARSAPVQCLATGTDGKELPDKDKSPGLSLRGLLLLAKFTRHSVCSWLSKKQRPWGLCLNSISEFKHCSKSCERVWETFSSWLNFRRFSSYHEKIVWLCAQKSFICASFWTVPSILDQKAEQPWPRRDHPKSFINWIQPNTMQYQENPKINTKVSFKTHTSNLWEFNTTYGISTIFTCRIWPASPAESHPLVSAPVGLSKAILRSDSQRPWHSDQLVVIRDWVITPVFLVHRLIINLITYNLSPICKYVVFVGFTYWAFYIGISTNRSPQRISSRWKVDTAQRHTSSFIGADGWYCTMASSSAWESHHQQTVKDCTDGSTRRSLFTKTANCK